MTVAPSPPRRQDRLARDSLSADRVRPAGHAGGALPRRHRLPVAALRRGLPGHHHRRLVRRPAGHVTARLPVVTPGVIRWQVVGDDSSLQLLYSVEHMVQIIY